MQFQDKFSTGTIPMDPTLVSALEKEVPYPYPSQVTVIGSLFPVAVHKESWEKMDGKVTREDGEYVYLKQSRNLLVCFPTSAGKTFLLKIFLLMYLGTGTSFYTLPLKALAEEKYAEFTKQFPGLKIGIMTGDYQNITRRDVGKYDCIITTYEKFDSFLRNSFDDMKRMISSVVIDEVHVLNSDRGRNIEDFVMKLKRIGTVPIMATSATVGNAKAVARWLDADLFVSKFRPVPLKKGVLIGNEIEYEDGTFEKFKMDEDANNNVEMVILKKMQAGEQLMYVRATRNFASSFAKKMAGIASKNKIKITDLNLPYIKTKDEKDLDSCLKYGIAWHHAGLRGENRTYIESMFRAGHIKFLCATTTLSAGVNLPSKYVLLDWKRFNEKTGYPDAIPIIEALQILGRAGRPQYDSIGFGILVCKNDKEYEYCMDNYLSLPPEDIVSPFIDDENNLFHSVLGNMGTIASTRKEFQDLYAGSFGALQERAKIARKLDSTLESFSKFPEKLVKVDDNGKYSLTEIGSIVKRYYVDPNDATIIIEMIRNCKALSSLAVVHAIMKCHVAAPISIKGKIGWEDRIEDSKARLYYDEIDMYERGQVKEIQTAIVLVGTGTKNEVIYADENVTSEILCEHYGIEMGDLQRVVGPGGKVFWMLRFAIAVATHYKKEDIKKMLAVTGIRLKYGIGMKIVPLCMIDGIGKERGRSLYDSGFKTIQSVASARKERLASVDVNGRPLGETVAEKSIASASNLVDDPSALYDQF